MVTQDERNLIRRIFSQGPSVLFDNGYDVQSAQEFLQRDDVKAELTVLTSEFSNQDALSARTRFSTRQQIAKLAPGAVAVLGSGLLGPVYRRDAKGAIELDVKGRPVLDRPEPTLKQLRSAEVVLDSLGIDPRNKNGPVDINLNLSIGVAAARVLDHDPEDKVKGQQTLSRERQRTTIEALMAKFPDLKDRVLKKLELSKREVKKKKSKHKS